MRRTVTAAMAVFLMCRTFCAVAQFRCEITPPEPLHNGPDTVSLIVIGDVMMHAKQLDYEQGPFLKEISPALKAADFALANAEFSLGGPPYSGYPSFSTPDSYAEYLVDDCGIDVLLTANNHILDRGDRGVLRTLHVYDSLAVRHTGAYSDQEDLDRRSPLVLFKSGISIALVNFTYGTNHNSPSEWPRIGRMKEDQVREAMRKAKASGADFIIALPHWGQEYSLHHNEEQERWAKLLVEEGADAIIGAHPHVVQDSTHIEGVPVVYSLGNAVSNMSATNTRVGLAVVLNFVHDPVAKTCRMLEPELRFTWCCLPGMRIDNYSTIFIKEWTKRRDAWSIPSDFDNMIATYERVKAATGISD